MNKLSLSDAGEEWDSLDSLLEPLPPEDLRVLIGKLVARDPHLADEIKIQLELLRTRPAAMQTNEAPPEPVDASLILKAVRATLREARGYGAASAVADEVRDYLSEATGRVEAGDGRSALAILEAITEGISGAFEIVDDSDADVSGLYDDLGPAWTEALLTADPMPTERRAWAKKLRQWQREVDDYGVDEPFSAAIETTRQGWDDPTLIRVMRGDLSQEGFQTGQAPQGNGPLAVARINVLERQGRYQEALYLAEAASLAVRFAILLVRLDRVEEAVVTAQREFRATSESLDLAQVLHERQAIDEALRVGEQGLLLDGTKAMLGRWLRDAAIENGRTDLAIRAATAALNADPELDDYKRLQEIAAERWPQVREELLTLLRRPASFTPSGTVEIFLYAGLMEDALSAVESSYNYDLIARVVDAATPTQPYHAILICRPQAESIMNRGRSSHYDAAVGWLARAKTAYRVAGQVDEWQNYLSELLTIHKSKYKLVPMLKTLERG